MELSAQSKAHFQTCRFAVDIKKKQPILLSHPHLISVTITTGSKEPNHN